MFAHRCLMTLTFLALLSYNAASLGDEEHPRIVSSSKEFERGSAAAIQRLEKQDFQHNLESFSFGAVNSNDIDALVTEIRMEKTIAGLSPGNPNIVYDVILQPGHYGRKTGAIGTSGRRVLERALVSYITARVAQNLRDRHVSVLVIAADTYASNLRSKVFLAIHADGSTNECSTGPSLAYSSRSSTYAMHAIGWALGSALGYTYEEFKRDNYTVNEAKYYMFRNLQAQSMKGLLEIGELTCQKMEDRLIEASNAIADNVALALSFISQVSDGANDSSPR